MEPDSNGHRPSYRRLATLMVVLSLALVPLSGLGAAQQASAAGNQSYVAVQGEECTPITPFSDNESAIEYYDYRLPENFSDNPYANATGTSFSSEGTTDLQEPNTSSVFLYTDTTNDSTYLVFVHGAVDNESADGGVATFNITGLPEDGNWTVRDDDYEGNTSTDNWTVTNTTSSVDWDWDEEATDGGVYSGVGNDTNVTIEPAFNEEAGLYGSADGTVESWQVLSNDSDNVTRTDLDMNETLRLSADTCDDVDADDDGDTDADDADDSDDETNETATVNFEDQESDGTIVTVDNVTVPDDGYVAIHNDSLLDGDAVGSVIGVSEYLEAGTYDNLTVDLFDVPGADFNESELTENATLIAMPHDETTGDESYDFVSSNGTDDGPFLDDGAAVTDDAAVTVVNDTDDNETATVNFEDQESDGTTVTIANVTVPNDGYVAIHNDSLLDGDAVGSVIGVSEYLEAGDYEDIEVELFDIPGADFNESDLTENATLIAMPHEETTGDESYGFVSSNGTDDGPFIDDGEAVTDDAAVTVDNDTDDNETNETATVNFEDQESDGTTVTVDNVTVPDDGYVAIHNDSLLDGDAVGSVIGVSEYLEAGTYDDLDVELFDVPGTDFDESELTENETLIAMPHEETTGDESYDFVSSNGADDGPYTDDGEAVTDDAAITLANDTDDNATQTPENDTPENDTPVDTPADDTPTDTPADDTPTDTPADDTPADDTPADDTPADDTPADDTPADDTPVDTPADDTPADDTLADDTPTGDDGATPTDGGNAGTVSPADG